MPIFARKKMILQDDCFDVLSGFPSADVSLKYKGPEPQKVYQKTRELFWTVFQVKEGERVQERDYEWKRSGKREDFKVKWNIVKEMDRMSYLFFKVSLKGFAEETKNGKEGEFEMDMTGVIRTEYPQDNVWERTIFYEMARVFWSKVFYQDKRFKYQGICRSMLTTFRNELKAFFNLLPKS
ncbi:MAG: hypothetical protein ISS48_04520 [Candidatus Aenigmarchaeota archaeon]|nr:hypothetical protein [Candidatus Aenigmarchaeota archaeon]